MKPATILLLAAALLPASAGRAREAPTLKDQRLSACYGDMQRLCGGTPTKALLKTCIRHRLDAVSPACRAWMGKAS